MKLKPVLLSLLGVALMVSGAAAATQLSGGKYVANLSPGIDEPTADRIEKQLSRISEIQSVDVKPKEATLHFKVKDNAQVDIARVTDAVKTAAPSVMVSDPLIDPDSAAPATTGAAPSEPVRNY